MTITVRNVTLFIASTTQQPVIRPNPETGEYEHHAAHWKDFDDAEKSLHKYLRPTIAWVRQIIGEGE